MLYAAALSLSLLGLQAPKPLAFACRDGDIAVECGSYASYGIAYLNLQNLRERDLLLDVNGSYLAPQSADVQRLGLALREAGSSDTIVHLSRGEQATVKVLSVCMDASKAPPTKDTEYSVSKHLAPPTVRALLELWKCKPDIPQSFVQSAVWGHTSTFVEGRKGTDLSSAGGALKGTVFTSADFGIAREYAFHRGKLYALTQHGDLFRGVGDVPLALLDRKFVDLFSDGRLFAIRRVPSQTARTLLDVVLSELDPDTGGWADLFRTAPGEILWVAPDAEAAIIRDPDDVVLRIDGSGRTKLVEQPVSIAVTSGGEVFWIPKESPMSLYRLDKSDQPKLVYEHTDRLAAVVAPEGMPYLQDCRGMLLGLKAGKWTALRDDVLAMELLSGKLLIKTKSRSRVREHLPGKVLISGQGEAIAEFAHPRHLSQHYLSPPYSDAVLSIDGASSLRLYDRQRRTWQLIGRLAR